MYCHEYDSCLLYTGMIYAREMSTKMDNTNPCLQGHNQFFLLSLAVQPIKIYELINMYR